ncbi:MAG: hypothetical protein ACE5NM_09520, partial [Sedimentisphaerales bacterium]
MLVVVSCKLRIEKNRNAKFILCSHVFLSPAASTYPCVFLAKDRSRGRGQKTRTGTTDGWQPQASPFDKLRAGSERGRRAQLGDGLTQYLENPSPKPSVLTLPPAASTFNGTPHQLNRELSSILR